VYSELHLIAIPVLQISFSGGKLCWIVSWPALPLPKSGITRGLAASNEGDHVPMKIIKTAFLSSTLLLAVGAFAWQYPSGGSQPSQQPQTQPSQPSQSQPSQNPGAAQPGAQSQQPQGSGQPGQAHSIDDQVQALAGELKLSPEQQAKVKTALEDQHSQAMEVIQDNSLPREDKIQKIHAIRENTIAKVRGTLTSDEQKQKFDQMLQAQDDRMHQQQQAPPQQPAQQPPPKH
jgi:hypothetical protein